MWEEFPLSTLSLHGSGLHVCRAMMSVPRQMLCVALGNGSEKELLNCS